ncbi:hypothetical protein VNO77_33680 [Canavalia gladiata]|uniref:WRKY domain-containing protein n=1 Tax=Canavalia gladiata TaxID=3824 RepID=A0AAN9KCX0_CANGL
MAHEDWDLFAIVRSCKAATFTATANSETPLTTTNTRSSQDNSTAMSCFDAFTFSQEINGSFSFPNLVQPTTNGFLELHQLLMKFNPTTNTGTNTNTNTNTIFDTSTNTSGVGINPNSTFSDVIGFNGHHPLLVPAPTNYTSIGTPSTTSIHRFHHNQQQPQTSDQQEHQKRKNQPPLQVPQSSSMLSSNTQPQTPRSRKRKSQQKRMVCHVTADNLSADLWAWRKYGQKPIKGSPYPRNYYRCSSCKGCAARKQVERSTTEPNMFIVTYTGDHKHAKPVHRNSLAGSTRSKPSTTRLPAHQETASPQRKGSVSPSSSLLPSMVSKSGTPEKEESHVATGEPDPETEPDTASDMDDDVLIPNTAAMSDSVLLRSTNCYGNGVETG